MSVAPLSATLLLVEVVCDVHHLECHVVFIIMSTSLRYSNFDIAKVSATVDLKS